MASCCNVKQCAPTAYSVATVSLSQSELFVGFKNEAFGLLQAITNSLHVYQRFSTFWDSRTTS